MVTPHADAFEHIERYGLLTPEAYAAITGGKIEAAAKALNRMSKRGFLYRHRLIGVVPYYTLDMEPLKAEALKHHYAVLIDTVYRKASLLSPLECQGSYSWLPKGAYAIDNEGGLAALRVDAGYPARYVARKCHEWLAKSGARPEFHFEAQRGRINLRVLTTTTAKARQIQGLVRSPIPLDIVVIPKFAELLGRRLER